LIPPSPSREEIQAGRRIIYSERMEVDPSYSRAPWMVEADEGIRCLPDRALDRDVRVLTNVVRGSQKLGKTQQIFDYFAQGSQPLLRPHMRKIVTEWMMELTAQEKCHPEVLALAVNYMDRMLCRFQIHKNQFQLLASTCVFLASKFRENEPVTAEKLVVMTDFSISVDLILEWELLVLQVLNWDLSTVTPYTILNQLLTHKCLQTFQGPLEDLSPTIRLRAETLLALACTENQFTTLPPTLVGTGCFLATVRSQIQTGKRERCPPGRIGEPCLCHGAFFSRNAWLCLRPRVDNPAEADPRTTNPAPGSISPQTWTIRSGWSYL